MLLAFSYATFVDGMFEEVSSRGAVAVLGMFSGALLTWLVARWKRHKQRQSILRGDARDSIVIEQHLVTSVDVPSADGRGTTQVPATLRIRSLGQSELCRVVPNGHLAGDLLRRATHMSPHETLISMEGAEGSYLLETLSNFVCDRVGNEPFPHDVYVMAPCCEPVGLSVHQPISIVLISVEDLKLFETWTTCKDVQVEHGSDGMRVLTLVELARRFKAEREKIAGLVKAGKPVRHEETMYLLDLCLDRQTASIPVKGVRWSRFADAIEELQLDGPLTVEPEVGASQQISASAAEVSNEPADALALVGARS